MLAAAGISGSRPPGHKKRFESVRAEPVEAGDVHGAPFDRLRANGVGPKQAEVG
jgi:hypothetical protein